ncbi:hypothetical protein EDC04DRAFT_2729284, partial [Pisolithus marmoratus]
MYVNQKCILTTAVILLANIHIGCACSVGARLNESTISDSNMDHGRLLERICGRIMPPTNMLVARVAKQPRWELLMMWVWGTDL